MPRNKSSRDSGHLGTRLYFTGPERPVVAKKTRVSKKKKLALQAARNSDERIDVDAHAQASSSGSSAGLKSSSPTSPASPLPKPPVKKPASIAHAPPASPLKPAARVPPASPLKPAARVPPATPAKPAASAPPASPAKPATNAAHGPRIIRPPGPAPPGRPGPQSGKGVRLDASDTFKDLVIQENDIGPKPPSPDPTRPTAMPPPTSSVPPPAAPESTVPTTVAKRGRGKNTDVYTPSDNLFTPRNYYGLWYVANTNPTPTNKEFSDAFNKLDKATKSKYAAEANAAKKALQKP